MPPAPSALDGARPLGQGDARQPQHRLAVRRRPGARRPPRTGPRWWRCREAQLEVARKNLADAEVRAPFDGVVGERIANQGESLPIDGKILALLDTSHVEIAAQMPAADVVRLKVGQAATVILEGFGERVVQRPDHAHQPDGAGRLALDPGLCRDPDRHEACAAGCSPRAPSSSRRRPTRWPCPPRRCARTTRATSCWRSRRRSWCASRSAPCAPGRAASWSR